MSGQRSAASAEAAAEYAAWREGPEWQASRGRFRRRRRARRCAFHGRGCFLVQAHHWARLFYAVRGREAAWMLVSLCDGPHLVVHRLSRWLFGHHLRGLPVTTGLVVAAGKLNQLDRAALGALLAGVAR